MMNCELKKMMACNACDGRDAHATIGFDGAAMEKRPRTGVRGLLSDLQGYGTVIDAVVLLFVSLLSPMRLTSSTQAWTVCVPDTAGQ